MAYRHSTANDHIEYVNIVVILDGRQENGLQSAATTDTVHVLAFERETGSESVKSVILAQMND